MESNGKADYNLFIYLAKRVSRKDALVSYACSGLSLCTCSLHTHAHTLKDTRAQVLDLQNSIFGSRAVERGREREMECESCEGDTSNEI